MKVSITLSVLSVSQAKEMLNFASAGEIVVESLPDIDPSVAAWKPPAEVTETVAEEAKPKRKRRSKAEMKAARAAEEEEKTDASTDEAPKGRRRRAAAASESGAAAKTEDGEGTGRRRRRRRGAVAENPTEAPANTSTTKSPSDEELTDADMAKVASEAARVLTPNVVTEVLEQFGVRFVGDLDQEQRRELVDLLKDKIDSAKPSGE